MGSNPTEVKFSLARILAVLPTSGTQTYKFIRSTRIWNLLTGRMVLANATLTSFKSFLYDYYSRAVRMNYNPDNPRSFKTICLKCNSIRFLGKVKGKVCIRANVGHQAGAYPGFRSMKRLGVFLLPPGWDASPSQGYPQH